MKKTALIFSVLFVLLLSCSTAFAGAQDFTLVNDSGSDISFVYVSPTNVNDWQEDVMGTDILENGNSVEITFDRGDQASYWDIKVIYSDGSERYWTKFNLKEISTITLLSNGKARYE